MPSTSSTSKLYRSLLAGTAASTYSVPLYVSTSGLRTSLVPYGSEGVELAFDFIAHELTMHTTTGCW